MSMKVKKDDTVLVITGKDKGKKAKVLSTIPKTNRIVVEGVNMQKRHKKARSAQDIGGIIPQNGSINSSNVMVVCPKCEAAVRIGYKFDVDGNKYRYCRKCGAPFEKVKEVKEENKASKKATK